MSRQAFSVTVNAGRSRDEVLLSSTMLEKALTTPSKRPSSALAAEDLQEVATPSRRRCISGKSAPMPKDLAVVFESG